MGKRANRLSIFHGNRLERLCEILLTYVAQYPLPALSPDLWVVQGQGMKAWLEAQAATHPQLGILAATRILQPASALWELQRLVLGPHRVPAQLPLDESALVWRVMAWLDALPQDDPVWHALVHHLDQSPPDLRTRRQFQLAQHIADVFDAYQTHRPDWLRDWSQGRAQVRLSPAHVQALPESQHWQALLWRELVAQAKAQTQLEWVSRDQVFEAFQHALAAPQLSQGTSLPERLIVLGVSALPIEHIRALGALSRHMEVLIFALNPSEAYWGDARRRSLWPVQDLLAEPSSQDHPLLAAWGQQARDFLHLVDEADPHTDPRQDAFIDPLGESGRETVLAQLQADILANRHPHRDPKDPLPTDDSLVFCQAHSPLREVQALHDQVLTWLAQDPQLQPRDIVVMVSDLTAFEPWVRTTWGALAESDPRHVPFDIARPQPEQAAMLEAVQAGLDLLQSPFTLGSALSWLSHPAVRSRFELSEDDLHRLGQWLQDSGVRWGLDTEHATRHGWPQGLAAQSAHTWVHGLQRLLLSHAMGTAASTSDSPPAWQGLLALDGVGGVNADCLNGLVQCLDALRHFEVALRPALTPTDWRSQLAQWLSQVFQPTSESEEAVLNLLQQTLGEWQATCTASGFDRTLPLSVVGKHWLESVRAAQMGARLVSGGVVFTTAMPLQSVPFKRVALLGLNDGQFPRLRNRLDFDLLDTPGWGRPGDRSRHDDDRYLLLQALLSARDGVYLSWQGFQAQDGKPLPASVLVNQLLDVLNQTVGQAWPVHTLPLQAHGLAYFEAAHAQEPAWSTHAHEWHAARQASWQAKPKTAESSVRLATATATGAPSATPPEDWTSQGLMAWLRRPIEAFAKERLGVVWPEPPEAWPDAEPFALSPLSQHHWVQAGARAKALPAALSLSGELSAGSLGQLQWQELDHDVMALVQRAQALTCDWTRVQGAMHWDLALTPRTLRGQRQHAELWQSPQGLQLTQVSASRLIDPKNNTHTRPTDGKASPMRPRLPQLLRAGVAHVLASASGQALHTHLIGPDAALDWPPLDAPQALAVLQQWRALHEAAWGAPMPVVCDLAGLWLTLKHSPAMDAATALRKADEAVLLKADLTQQHPSWAFKRDALVQRFLPDPQAALLAVQTWADALYLPLLASLHVTVHGGARHLWLSARDGEAA